LLGLDTEQTEPVTVGKLGLHNPNSFQLLNFKLSIFSHLYNRKGLCLFSNIFVAYGDRQRYRDTGTVVGLQGLESGYQKVGCNFRRREGHYTWRKRNRLEWNLQEAWLDNRCNKSPIVAPLCRFVPHGGRKWVLV
jgi:hypothetical protein